MISAILCICDKCQLSFKILLKLSLVRSYLPALLIFPSDFYKLGYRRGRFGCFFLGGGISGVFLEAGLISPRFRFSNIVKYKLYLVLDVV